MILQVDNNQFKTLDDKTFPFRHGDQKSRSEAYRKAEIHNADYRADIEAKFGRRITDRELLHGIDHSEDRDFNQRMNDESFKVAKKPPGRFAAIKDDLYKKIADEEYRKLSITEQRLADIERIENRESEKVANQQATEEYLSDPRTKKALNELNGLLRSMRFDDTRGKGEVVRVEQAIQQWSAPDGDPATARQMLKTILGHEDERTGEMNNAKREKIKSIEATLAVEKADLPKIRLDTSRKIDQQGNDLFMGLSKADYPMEVLDNVNTALEQMREGNNAPIESAISKYGFSDAVPGPEGGSDE